MTTKRVTVRAKKAIFLPGGKALAAGATTEMAEAQAKGYPRDELVILGPPARAPKSDGPPKGDEPPKTDP